MTDNRPAIEQRDAQWLRENLAQKLLRVAATWMLRIAYPGMRALYFWTSDGVLVTLCNHTHAESVAREVRHD